MTTSPLAFPDADKVDRMVVPLYYLVIIAPLYLVPLPVGASHIPTPGTQARPRGSRWSRSREGNGCASLSRQKLSELLSDSLFRGAWPGSRERVLCQPLPTEQKRARGQGPP